MVAMMALRLHFRQPVMLVAAMALMLSLSGNASACSASGMQGNCCTSSAGSACCCDVQAVEPQPGSSDRAEARISDEGTISSPVSPCVCRPGGPTEPASKPRSTSSHDRPDRDHVRVIEIIPETRPAIAVVRSVVPTESPPGAPLYLRTSHLLI